MRFSTKAEYGLKAMVNLAKGSDKPKSLNIIAREESISVKYLERIFNILRKSNLIESVRGAGGGYRLAGKAGSINVAQVVIALEGPISPMKCVGKACQMEHACSSKIVWEKLGSQIEKTLKSIRLSDLTNKQSRSMSS